MIKIGDTVVFKCEQFAPDRMFTKGDIGVVTSISYWLGVDGSQETVFYPAVALVPCNRDMGDEHVGTP